MGGGFPTREWDTRPDVSSEVTWKLGDWLKDGRLQALAILIVLLHHGATLITAYHRCSVLRRRDESKRITHVVAEHLTCQGHLVHTPQDLAIADSIPVETRSYCANECHRVALRL